MNGVPHVTVRRTADNEYEVRPAGSARAAAGSAVPLTELPSLLSAHPQEEFAIRFLATSALQAFFDKRALERTSLGWEGVLFPGSPVPRRKLATPPGFEFSPGIRGLSATWLAGCHPLAGISYSRPDLSHDDSILIRRDSRPVGWVPVQHLSAGTSAIKTTFLEADVFAEETRNLSYLKLSAWSVAMHRQHEMGRTVVAFIADDGDDLNAYKLQISGADVINRWWLIRTRRDFYLMN